MKHKTQICLLNIKENLESLMNKQTPRDSEKHMHFLHSIDCNQQTLLSNSWPSRISRFTPGAKINQVIAIRKLPSSTEVIAYFLLFRCEYQKQDGHKSRFIHLASLK